MKVSIMYRNSWFGGEGWTYYPTTVDIGNFLRGLLQEKRTTKTRLLPRRQGSLS
ncbi:MAG: hypothetical protein HC773_05620 [Scytonema sp. CRU_2_7]|nr:hypothetical protein [Scytonema sp. CRU_2_7]